MNNEKPSIAIYGCGFLASHLIPNLLPFAERLILIDRERLELENYQNGIFLKNQINRFKTSNLGTITQLFSSVPVSFYQKDIKTPEQIKEIKADLAIITFDNPESRKLLQEHLDIPGLNIGVTDKYAAIDWLENMPEIDDSDKVKESMQNIGDICSREELRWLGVMASSYAFLSFYLYYKYKEKISYYLTVGNGIPSLIQKGKDVYTAEYLNLREK
jgi:hypothetical protein